MMAAPYGERYAKFYDLLYADKPYDREAAVLSEIFCDGGVAPGARILELACGTGQHAVRLARYGYRVTATDYSAAMVAQARINAESQDAGVQFDQLDMRELPVPKLAYDATICLFDSIGYVQTDAAIAATLQGVHAGLRPGGLFVFDFWHAPAMKSRFDPQRVRRVRRDETTILRISETELDPQRSLAHVTFDVYELRSNYTYDHISERHTNRYFTVDELESRGRQHGFMPVAALPGFSDGTAISDTTWHIVAVWRKA